MKYKVIAGAVLLVFLVVLTILFANHSDQQPSQDDATPTATQ